eukprot:m.150561 g.150561  ORF g.150561 m.150561 type:complete len:109 (+) comp20667_c2_seq2:363-689(+)
MALWARVLPVLRLTVAEQREFYLEPLEHIFVEEEAWQGCDPRVPMRLLRQLYDANVVSEEALLAWSKESPLRQGGSPQAQCVWSGVEPFIKWLLTADEESDEEEEDDD